MVINIYVFFNEQDALDEIETLELMNKIESSIDHLSLEQLRKIQAIIDEEC